MTCEDGYSRHDTEVGVVQKMSETIKSSGESFYAVGPSVCLSVDPPRIEPRVWLRLKDNPERPRRFKLAGECAEQTKRERRLLTQRGREGVCGGFSEMGAKGQRCNSWPTRPEEK